VIAIIGGGHNGMVAALRLAQLGHQVSLFERREQLGGICASEEFAPGFFTDGLSHHTESWSPELSEKLGLSLALKPPAGRFLPEVEGDGIHLHYDPEEAQSELTRRGKGITRYREFRSFIDSIRPLVNGVAKATPPPLSMDGSIFDYAAHALRFRGLGAEQMMEVLRIGAMSAADWVSEFSDDPLVQAALASPACFTAWLGPRSPTGTANLLYEESLRGHSLAGGNTGLVTALKDALSKTTVQVHTGVGVRSIEASKGAVTGLILDNGEQVDVTHVLATCSAQQTLLQLVNAKHIPIGISDQVLNIRARGTVSVAHFALNGRLDLTAPDGKPIERVVIGEHMDEWERCFDHAKHRQLAPQPCLDIRVLTPEDKVRCPEDHQILSIHAFGTPMDLEGGWTEAARSALEVAIVSSLEQYAPRVGGQIVGSRVLTPADLEQDYGLAGGHLFHCEHAIDQLWMTRPTPTLAQYKAPLEGLFLGSAASHPGGGVHGLCGLGAANALAGS
jgi:phytoene dehydrogenase-like protein